MLTGSLVAIAVSSGQRSATAPEVPAVAETLAGFEATSWHGLFAPAGTPPEIVKKIRDDVAEALQDPKNRAAVASLGLDIRADSPEAFSAFVAADVAKWNAFFKDLKAAK